MKRPIIFSTPMVQAIIEGRKIMTRRVFRNPYHPSLKAEPCDCSPTEGLVEVEFYNDLIALNGKLIEELRGHRRWTGCPHGVPGDGLWVRETWNLHGRPDISESKFIYKADKSESISKILPWKPSIYMPKIACRICLEITSIRFEMIQDISKNDAIREGIKVGFDRDDPSTPLYYFYPCGDLRDDSYVTDPICSFYSLWRSINGQKSWDNNPFVWVIEFKRV